MTFLSHLQGTAYGITNLSPISPPSSSAQPISILLFDHHWNFRIWVSKTFIYWSILKIEHNFFSNQLEYEKSILTFNYSTPLTEN